MMSQEVQESFRDIVQGCLRSDKNSCDALRQIPKRWEVGPTINFYTNFMSRMALTLNFDEFEEEDLHEISRNIFNTYILLAKRIKETIDPDQRALKELQMALGRAEKECKNAQSPFTLTLFNSLLVVFFDLRINKQFQVYMEGAPLPFTSSNSLSIDRARFHFLLGRFQLLNRMFPEARASFWKSLTEGYLNTARVYFYLTPLEIMNGNIPAIGQLEAVGIHDYRDLVVSIRDGNLALFEKQLHENMLKFTKYGVWEVGVVQGGCPRSNCPSDPACNRQLHN